MTGTSQVAPAPEAEPTTGDTPAPSPQGRGWWGSLRAGSRRHNVLAGAGAFVWLLVVGVPIYSLLVATIQPYEDYIASNPLVPPDNPTLDNYVTALNSGLFGFVWNTLLVTVAVVAIVVALTTTTAFAIVRARTRWTTGIFRVFLLGLAIPLQAVVIPVYLIINQLGLYDSLMAIVLPTAAFALPVCVLILTGSMRDISDDLYEAMAIDGAGSVRIFVQLVLPMSRSGISTVGIYAALQAWNGFLFPFLLTQSEENRLITLGLFEFQDQFGVNIPALLSAVVLSAIPILIVYLIARRSLVAGLMGVGGK
ncbi:xylobiose transport system permease protein [Lipingzhangella halophila]|uniref:Xylobiose transport system permease protein n=1 Tax=Lipingzhangella halophila TaxID=1783352 RepID=A0A7W7RM71_9ACTN|nr:carbohydrate ABC transporter permease [Lipingzhangella halophila]MBB4934549.1 xylobiose transport system permease protein [Lipingzhangella halophila]